MVKRQVGRAGRCSLWWLPCLAVVGAVACGLRPPVAPDKPAIKKPLVYVDCYPLAYFAQRIAEDAVEVVFPVPVDEDPAFWQPAATIIAEYQAADLILLNGAGYARWVQYASLPPSRVEDTSAGFQDQYLQIADAVVHKHGPQGEHAHEGAASHTWLDPRLARRQARAVRDALRRLLPAQAEQFERNWSGLDQELADWEESLSRLSVPPGRNMWASHPVYEYLGRFCRWNLKSVHWEPDEFPSEEEWQRFADRLQEHPSTWMIWEDEPLARTQQRLAELGVQCVVFVVCGNRPQSGDFLQAMRANTRRLADALQSAAASDTPHRAVTDGESRSSAVRAVDRLPSEAATPGTGDAKTDEQENAAEKHAAPKVNHTPQ